MSKSKIGFSICAVLIAGILTLPILAKSTTEEALKDSSSKEAVAASTEAAEKGSQAWEVESELEDGIYTIRIKSSDNAKKDYWWESYTGDKGDATFVELLTQSTDEQGLAYVGSFRAMDDTKGQGDLDDTIRLVHTDGVVVDEYMEFTVAIKDGKITESTGGSNCMPTPDDDFASIICGTWKATDNPEIALTISQNPEGGFDGSLTGSKDISAIEPYKFTAKYDCIQSAFLYNDGKCLFAIDNSSEKPEDYKILLHDPNHADEGDLVFEKAE